MGGVLGLLDSHDGGLSGNGFLEQWQEQTWF